MSHSGKLYSNLWPKIPLEGVTDNRIAEFVAMGVVDHRCLAIPHVVLYIVVVVGILGFRNAPPGFQVKLDRPTNEDAFGIEAVPAARNRVGSAVRLVFETHPG